MMLDICDITCLAMRSRMVFNDNEYISERASNPSVHCDTMATVKDDNYSIVLTYIVKDVGYIRKFEANGSHAIDWLVYTPYYSGSYSTQSVVSSYTLTGNEIKQAIKAAKSSKKVEFTIDMPAFIFGVAAEYKSCNARVTFVRENDNAWVKSCAFTFSREAGNQWFKYYCALKRQTSPGAL